VKRKAELIQKRKTDLNIHISAEGKEIASKKTTFIGPIFN
jgi:hypothetical protein